MRKKPEYKIIWVTPPDPVKLGTIIGEIYARGRGLEFVGLVPNEKKGEKALAIPPTPCAAALSRASTRSACASKTDGSAVYRIFKRLPDEWIAERGAEA